MTLSTVDSAKAPTGFTGEELAYIRSQPLARVATASDDGQPDAVPVRFQFDGTHFWIGGFDPTNTRRTRNIQAGNDRIALVIDDLAPGGSGGRDSSASTGPLNWSSSPGVRARWS